MRRETTRREPAGQVAAHGMRGKVDEVRGDESCQRIEPGVVLRAGASGVDTRGPGNNRGEIKKLARGFSTQPANYSVRKDSMPLDLTKSCDVAARRRVLCTIISPAAKTSWQSKLCNTWPAKRGKGYQRFSALREIRWRCYRHSLSARRRIC